VSLRSFVVGLRDGHHLPPWLRLSRYTIGSAICFGVSEVTFIALFGPNLLGARGASIVASIVGVFPGYVLNRTWTWGRRGRSNLRREVVPYWITALLSTAIAATVTGAVNAAGSGDSRDVRTLVNATAYMLTYGVLFVVKFAVFQRLFTPTPSTTPQATTPQAAQAAEVAEAAQTARATRYAG
jgi:putative flippase GtrA